MLAACQNAVGGADSSNTNSYVSENIMTKHRLSLVFVGAALLAAFAASAQARSIISCESREYRYSRCETSTDGYARLVSQQSQAPCIQGQTWGYDNRGLWVDKG